MYSEFRFANRCRLKENFVRRTTDTNRIVKQLCRACLGLAVAVTLVASPLTSCFAQPADSGLPERFRPPPPIPPELSIEKPLITEEEVTAWKPKRLEFQDALDKKSTPATMKVIDEGFRVLVHDLSIVENRAELTGIRKSIVRYIDINVETRNEAGKKFACKTVVKHAKTLLDGNLHVRMQAVLLIGSLNVSPEVPGIRLKPAVAYVDGLATLLDIIRAPEGGIDQPESVRILAAMSAQRLLAEGRHTLQVNSKIPVDCAQRMLAELTGNGSDWYHQRLIEGLAETALSSVPNEQNQQEPLIVEAMAKILANPRRSNEIRARAAYLLGRVPMPGGLQSAPIAYSIVKLAQKIATEVNQGRLPGGIAIFQLNDIYLSFVPQVKGETTTDGRKGAGLLSTLNQKPIKDAHADIKPVFQSIFRQYQAAGNKPIQASFAPGLIGKLTAWPKPADMALAQGRDDIAAKPLKPAAAAAVRPGTPAAPQPQANRQGDNSRQAS
ncbi:MAG: hypothetical protein ACI92S_004198 [Planctomycetaceae bacterium]|jgi:hypothetical protein